MADRNRLRLGRRALLRGLSGAALSLPFLEIMLDAKQADAAAPPLRFLVCFGGQSLGADDDPLHNDYVPSKVGPTQHAIEPSASISACFAPSCSVAACFCK